MNFFRRILQFNGIRKLAPGGVSAGKRWSKLAPELERLHGELGQVSGLNEPDFALLASDLGKLHQSTSTLSTAVEQSLATVLTRLESIRLDGDEGAASKTVAELESNLQRVRDQVTALEGTIQKIGELQHQSGAVRRIGSFLTACGLNFAVECSRRSETVQEFTAFCSDLRTLANTVSQAGERFGDECGHTHSVQSRAIQDLKRQLGEIFLLIAPAQQAVSATTQETQSLVGLTRRTLDLAVADSSQITRQAHDALFHLQLGDIVRQKCEHVSHALGIARERVREMASDSEGCTKIAGELYQILAIQAGQLQQMREEITSAHRELTEAFRGIGTVTGRLATQTASLTTFKADDTSSGNLFDNLQGALKNLEVIQKRGEQLRGVAGELHTQAGQSTARLGEQLHSVRKINAEIHLQSLNAIIRTCHLGEQGQTLGVLAMHMHDAFQDSNTCVQEVILTLHEILHGESSGGGENFHALQQEKEGDNRSDSFFKATSEIADLYMQLHEAAQMAVDVARQQEAHVANLQKRLEFLPTLTAELARREQDINALIAELEPHYAAGGMDEGIMAGLGQQYTMQSEREIHRRIIQNRSVAPAESAPAADSFDVEFFDMPCPPQDPESPKAAGKGDDEKRSNTPPQYVAPAVAADLGDNVELF